MSDAQFHLRLSEELLAWLKLRAALDSRSVNSYVVRVLEEWRKAKEGSGG